MAWYTMQEMNDLGGTGERRLFPRIKSLGTLTTDELVARMCEENTFGEGEARGMIGTLARHLVKALSEGRSVKIDGLGTFSLSLGLKGDTEAETADGDTRRNARSVEVRGVKFRADSRLVSDADRQTTLTRFPWERQARLCSSSAAAVAVRLAKAQAYLSEHAYMHVADYALLTGLPRGSAIKELRTLAATPGSGIASEGSGSHKVYVASE